MVLANAAVAARSVARAGFGLDSLIEIGPSAVVIGSCRAPVPDASAADCGGSGTRSPLAVYLLMQSTVVLASGYHPGNSVPGISWNALTAAAMFALAAGKARTGLARWITRCCGPRAGSR